ncbi:hypothetical protein [Sphaerisporangium sp. TRM90804]|uniref:hypothetical protein n=1 Tax=Sphaerisporangium sp. TRM90804 TaxID=3031113 RepID=UPI002446ECCB|nr:hypothetical protein [Sphaerisporangium sp. TRM90804]MDH2424144.1 hypothetical protein [Sphaerisporangium sp. TRM90804]
MGAGPALAGPTAAPGPFGLVAAQPYPPTPPDTQPPSPPFLTATALGGGLIRLTWTPSVDNVGVVAYDIYASASPFRLIATVAGNVLNYVDRPPRVHKISYFVRARDAAGNQSGRSNIVSCHLKGRHAHDEAEGREPLSRSELDRSGRGGEHDGRTRVIQAHRFLLGEESSGGGGGGHRHHDDSSAGAGAGGGGGGEGGGGYAPGGGHEGRPPVHAHPAAAQPGRLPFTGAPVAAVAGVGGILLAAGAGTVLVSVRRRRASSGAE